MMRRITAAERTLSVYALAQLGEIQYRKLYKDAGFHSMFAYCVGELGYSEPNASRRLQAAEAARNFPEVLSLVKDGRLTICALSLIAKHLTGKNSAQILSRVEGKSVRTVERIVAELAPLPDTRDMIRSLPVPAVDVPTHNCRMSAVEQPAVEPPAVEPPVVVPSASCAVQLPDYPRSSQKIVPRSPERVLFSFTGSEELRRVIFRCRDLMWHKHPAGRLEDVVLELGKYYLKLKDPELLPLSVPKAARPVETRAVPRWVRSAVYRHDEGRCVFTSVEGRRCEARHALEYDHIRPWARGGKSDDPTNIRLLCRAHNQWAAKAAGLG